MIQVLYFARYRELLDSHGESLPARAEWTTLDDLRRYLAARGGPWAVLDEAGLMCARNQQLCGLDQPLGEDDEIAFFPTVTGG